MARIHFSGVGGTAMIGGAYIAKQMGHEIRGSDNPLYPPTSILAKKLGIPIYEQYSANNLEWNPDYVIIGNALSREMRDIEAILSRRIPYISLPEWLRHNVLFKRKPVVVAGTHGKTTTTSLIAWVLQYAGLEPGFLIGGYPLNFDFPSFLGKEDFYFVIEGDEYDTAFFDKRAKFLHYLPQVLIVTSLEYDHSDIYNNVQEIEKAFQLLLRIVPKEGMVFLCEDNHAKMLRDYSFSQCQTYGFSKEAIWRVERRMGTDLNKMELSIFYKGKKLCTIQPNLLGKHNTLKF
jgi:UDP-N-acetylmuramate: L-alanyl-gamma-D-glutamyl-meso-diaminopimelate ligase